MSYNVTYNPELNRKYPTERRSKNKPLYIALILLGCFVAVYVLSQCGITHYLIPGDPEITTEAFSEMVARVSEGETVRNAVTEFCRKIINSGR